MILMKLSHKQLKGILKYIQNIYISISLMGKVKSGFTGLDPHLSIFKKFWKLIYTAYYLF